MDKQYIEKSAFLAEYEKAKRSNKTYTINGVLDATPTVDAVEVVRCKDCKHWTKDGNGFCLLSMDGGDFGFITNSQDFCSYGEKSESEAEK